jgi:4-hydroxyphenylpyruvate dioxygenase
MVDYAKPTVRPEIGVFHGFDHVTFWVGNAQQAASFYCSRLGFDYIAYQGLETGNRNFAIHVVGNGKIRFAFKTPYSEEGIDGYAQQYLKHGDGVKDVAFHVDDAAGLFQKAVERGATPVQEPTTMEDEDGKVILSVVKTYGDTTHTFVQRENYTGVFLPGFRAHHLTEPLNEIIPRVELKFIDHCVGNQPDGEMEAAASWYEKMLDFHRFWSVDDKMMHTEYSALRSVVVSDFDENVKMPINEPAAGKRKSQIQEYVDFYGGPGVQHIALRTDSIIDAVTNLRARGSNFLTIPDAYYDNLRKNIPLCGTDVKEDLDMIQKLNILVDYDEKGYLLQIFMKPLQDRPTFFVEIIQRENHQGFGAGNFKALFTSIEIEQEKRGNL